MKQHKQVKFRFKMSQTKGVSGDSSNHLHYYNTFCTLGSLHRTDIKQLCINDRALSMIFDRQESTMPIIITEARDINTSMHQQRNHMVSFDIQT